MKLYADYIAEREGAELYSDEHGFVTYKFENDVCIICDLYVEPKSRNTSKGSDYGKLIESICKENKVNKIYCFVDTNANNWKESLAFILKNGYEIDNTSTLIRLKKDLN